MATGTAAANPATREDPRQVINYLRQVANYNDVGIDTGLPFAQSLPKGCFITNVLVEIITAFNAVTTNVLTVGTVGTAYNNIVAAGDVDETAAATTLVGRALGRSLATAGDVTPYYKYTQTGTAASAGKAQIVICYTGGETIDGF